MAYVTEKIVNYGKMDKYEWEAREVNHRLYYQTKKYYNTTDYVVKLCYEGDIVGVLEAITETRDGEEIGYFISAGPEYPGGLYRDGELLFSNFDEAFIYLIGYTRF